MYFCEIFWAYLEDVAWLSAAHVDRSGHEVAAAGAVWTPHVDLGASLHEMALEEFKINTLVEKVVR